MKVFKQVPIVLAAVLLLTQSDLMAGKTIGRAKLPSLYKTSVEQTAQFDGNRIRNDMENNALIVSDFSGHSGLEWPKDNHTYTVYASAIWYAGLVDGDLRVAAGDYSNEFVPGSWGTDPSAAENKFYKASKSDLADPLANDDFQNWPVDLGAPWVDVDGDGEYNPLPNGPDYPDFIGDQIVWFVCNDGGAGSHGLFGTLPLGLEVQFSIFGFDRPDAFGDMMFVKALAINKGGNTIDSTYVGLWSDPDLGDAGDDFVGCDTTLSLGICYNDGVDADFAGYSGGTPAVGYDFFQGPIVPSVGDTALAYGQYLPGFKNLPMSSFVKYINPDAVYFDPNDATEVYNYMRGLRADGSPFPVEATGGTPFVHPGDPSLNVDANDTEYVDSDIHASGDRRFLMNAGPFTMAPGDSQEVVYGIFMAAAGDPLDSFHFLKTVDELAQLAYDIQFALPPSPPVPDVTVTTLKDEIILNWDDVAEYYEANDPIDRTPEGEDSKFVFEGYNVYQLETLSGTGKLKRIATFDLINGVKEIKDDVFDPNLGETINRRVQFGDDTGVKRSISISQDALNNGIPLKTNREYYFAVTAYGYNPYGIPKTLESTKSILAIRPQIPNTWVGNDDIAFGSGYNFTHEGPSDGSAEATVVDPTALTGHEYRVDFGIQHYYLDVDGKWKFTNYPDSVGRARSEDCSGSTITAAALVSGKVGTVDIIMTFDMVCGDNWVDGIKLDLPDNLIINSWEPLGDCNWAAYGQNCVNNDGTLDEATNSITWGDSTRSEFGSIEGGHVWKINVQPPDDNDYPFEIAYEVYDDGYDGTIVDANGTATVTELGYEFKSLLEWSVTDLDENTVVLDHQTMQGGVMYDRVVDGVFYSESDAFGKGANPVVDGLLIAINGPSNGIHGIYMVHDGIEAHEDYSDLPVASALQEHVWINYPDGLAYLENGNGGYYFATQGGGSPASEESYYARVFRGSNFSRAIPYDFEMRFTEKGSKAWLAYTTGEIIDVPFELWNIGSGTPDDTTDDYQMICWIYDYDGDGKYSWSGDLKDSGADNDPGSDWVYWRNPADTSPGTAGYEACANDPNYGYPSLIGGEVMARTVWNNWNGYGSKLDSIALSELSGPLPSDWTAADTAIFDSLGWFIDPDNSLGVVESDSTNWAYGRIILFPMVGSVYRWITNKPNTVSDKFTFDGSAYKGQTKAYEVSKVNVWPNPYFGYNPEERTPTDQQMHFTHLPETGEYNIRIFDLAGNHIKTITGKDVGSQFAVWDLRNDFGIPVASGMYIAHVEYGNNSKVLKLAVVQPEQRLDRY
jgi:hypothetical protein